MVQQREVAKELKKTNINNCTMDPCAENTCWYTEIDPKKPNYVNHVSCSCFDDFMEGPKSEWCPIFRLRSDLSRSLLTGTIPQERTETKLEFVSVFANRLSGPIPDYLGNISTLTYLSIESNLFNGTTPQLGNLIRLSNLILSDNTLIGSLPVELQKLNSLNRASV